MLQIIFFSDRIFAQLPLMESEVSLDQSRKILRIFKSISQSLLSQQSTDTATIAATVASDQGSTPLNQSSEEVSKQSHPAAATPRHNSIVKQVIESRTLECHFFVEKVSCTISAPISHNDPKEVPIIRVSVEAVSLVCVFPLKFVTLLNSFVSMISVNNLWFEHTTRSCSVHFKNFLWKTVDNDGAPISSTLPHHR
jgi:hypothetical protein